MGIDDDLNMWNTTQMTSYNGNYQTGSKDAPTDIWMNGGEIE